MTNWTDCEKTRNHFPDLIDTPSDAAAAHHVEKCVACREELKDFRAILEEASRLGQHDVPDPGAGYWERFLPSVRARIRAGEEADRSRTPLRLAAVVAAGVVMLAAGLALSVLPPPRVGSTGTAGVQLDSLLVDIEKLPIEQIELLALQVWDPFDPAGPDGSLGEMTDLDPGEVLDALETMDEPPGYSGFWPGDLTYILQDLDTEQVDQLRRQIADEATIQVNS